MFSFLKFMSVLPLVTTFRTIFGTSLRTRTVEMITWTIPIRFVWQKKKHVETSSQKLKGCGSSEFARFKQARKLQATLPSPKLWITYLLTYSLTAVRWRATSVADKNDLHIFPPLPATTALAFPLRKGNPLQSLVDEYLYEGCNGWISLWNVWWTNVF